MMKVLLVELTPAQVEHARAAAGSRKKITHAVVCGDIGQIFGTETYCRKYYDVWCRIFPNLFDGGQEVTNVALTSFESTFNLVNILIAENEGRGQRGTPRSAPTQPSTTHGSEKSGFLSRIFGK